MSSSRLLAVAATAALLGTGCDEPAPGASKPAAVSDRLETGVRPPPVIVRPRLVNMGRLRPGARHSRRIEARASSRRVAITGAGVDDPRFTIEGEDARSDGGPGSFTLEFGGSREVGPIAAEVVIRHRDPSGIEGATVVPVVGSVAGDLRVARGIYLHKRGGRFAPRDVVIGRRSGRLVRLRSVEDPDGLLEVTLVEPRSRLASFRVEVADPRRDYDGAAGHPLLLYVDDADESPVKVEYRIDSMGE